MSIDLIFSAPLPPNERPLNLVFGAAEGSGGAQTGVLHIPLFLPAPVMAAQYSPNVWRGVHAGFAAPHADADALQALETAPWRQAASLAVDDPLPWAESDRVAAGIAIPLRPVGRVSTVSGVGYDTAEPARAEAATAWDQMIRRRAAAALPFEEAGPVSAGCASGWIELLRTARPELSSAWELAHAISQGLVAPFRSGRVTWLHCAVPWDQARPAPAGISDHTVTPPVPEPACYTPPAGHAVNLLFVTPWMPGNKLVFKCRDFDLPADFLIPYRKVYVAVHTITCETYPGGEPLALFDPVISADADSYCWSLSATGPEELMEQLAGTAGAPAQIRITIDGSAWVFAVERMGRTRQFGKRRAQLTARSVTAMLGDPWAAESAWSNGGAMLAAQIVDQALDLTGITADWGLDDWLVPAGAWSHQGTPLSAVLRVAESVGAVVQSDRASPTLRLMPRYALMPWEWSGPAVAPNVQLPLASIIRESYERRDAPAYNRAIVSGVSQGVLGIITRAGTAGDRAAPLVTDSLATAQEAVLQRGRAILGAAGRQAWIGLDLPVLTGGTLPGVLSVGQLAEVVEPADSWRGLVRSVQVRVTGGRVRQTVNFERHLE